MRSLAYRIHYLSQEATPVQYVYANFNLTRQR